ncbi:MAG TPA: hypothetical protein VGE05_04220, partial [Novosphingobium sp.]
MTARLFALGAMTLAPLPAMAQEHSHAGIDHAAMDHDAAAPSEDDMAMAATSRYPATAGSGTSLLPANEGMDGLHVPLGDWT